MEDYRVKVQQVLSIQEERAKSYSTFNEYAISTTTSSFHNIFYY